MASPLMDPRVDEGRCSVKANEPSITVLVGPDKHTFQVSESIIRKPGTFFDSALRKEWKEGQDRIVELPTDEPDIFKLYVQWLNTEKIPCKTKQCHRNYDVLGKLYCLGDKLLDTTFQDRVMDAMVAASHDTDLPRPEEPDRRYLNDFQIDHIYQNTKPGAPIRGFIIDLHVLHGYEGWTVHWLESPENINREFLVDLGIAMMAKRVVSEGLRESLESLDANPGCAYHHHGIDQPCESKSHSELPPPPIGAPGQ